MKYSGSGRMGSPFLFIINIVVKLVKISFRCSLFVEPEEEEDCHGDEGASEEDGEDYDGSKESSVVTFWCLSSVGSCQCHCHRHCGLLGVDALCLECLLMLRWTFMSSFY